MCSIFTGSMTLHKCTFYAVHTPHDSRYAHRDVWGRFTGKQVGHAVYHGMRVGAMNATVLVHSLKYAVVIIASSAAN